MIKGKVNLRYGVVTVGGTFDYFHKGHRKVLKRAFEISGIVLIGVTSDNFKFKVKSSKLKVSIQNSKVRKEHVQAYLERKGLSERAQIVEIHDMFGPLKEVRSEKSEVRSKNTSEVNCQLSTVNCQIEAMVVTRETRSNAEKINRWRKGEGLEEVDIVEVAMVVAGDGEPISSGRIRAGEINREGVVYARQKLWGKLPKEMRGELRRPLGEIIQSFDTSLITHYPLLITIGDISTKVLIEEGIKPDIAVFDLKVQRRKVFQKPEEVGLGSEYEIVRVRNRAGEINREVWDFFSTAVDQYNGKTVEQYNSEKVALWVEGEEDLVTLVAVLFAPLGAIVIYGQPGEGMVVVEVTEEVKERVYKLIKSFKRVSNVNV